MSGSLSALATERLKAALRRARSAPPGTASFASFRSHHHFPASPSSGPSSVGLGDPPDCEAPESKCFGRAAGNNSDEFGSTQASTRTSHCWSPDSGDSSVSTATPSPRPPTTPTSPMSPKSQASPAPSVRSEPRAGRGGLRMAAGSEDPLQPGSPLQPEGTPPVKGAPPPPLQRKQSAHHMPKPAGGPARLRRSVVSEAAVLRGGKVVGHQSADSLPSPVRLAAEMNDLRHSAPLPTRRRFFMAQCLRWHPDKNAGNEELATEMFQMLQSKKEWFLKDDG